MKMNKVEIVSLIALILILIFMLTGCGTVAGMGKDISDAAQWTHDKMATPAKTEPAKQESAK